MAISRSARISLLLFIDFIFFLVELIVGYAVGSLALVADSFHMLNDIMSLVVALYAIKCFQLSKQEKAKDSDTRYSYGWHRAEILAALVNGVFLLALCFSIFMEAIERFFSTPEISNPKLVVIVGSLGLASNIFGLFLFHDHDHSHDHGHSHGKTSGSAEPQDSVVDSDASSTSFEETRGRTREGDESYTDHPAVFRQAVVQAAQDLQQQTGSSSRTRAGRATSPVAPRKSYRTSAKSRDATKSDREDSETTPLLGGAQDSTADAGHTHESTTDTTATLVNSKPHPNGHKQAKAGSMNMRALVLHVLGDALGNVGVIATGLVIWLTQLSWKFYFDPIISLVITVIIFSSALPLVKSASFILLQGVPAGISLEEVENTVLRVKGVEEVHELHIWQLSESKLIASLHVRTNPTANFMQVAVEIKKHLHDRGIHSVTIQPEYYDSVSSPPYSSGRVSPAKACLLTCQQDCNLQENACCPPPPDDV
ncbi:cation efflux protein [Schizopora paradoxa]|uniref:Cation efflux protein n=1 Tax=Schizopora paradoxa TaxID=27342 RepID=A0A0H2RBV4_9AGAM|nr:cation efflux protein [Schizopora paradoxa]